MSQEIIYTSAQKGLRSGSFGFCTVCSTAGMEPNMADFLEGISAYPHPYKPPDPRTKENPVNFSHIIWTIGGQRFHVLSRVCDAGLDYTGRTNLLAHHIALTRREAEAAVGGPAWVLSDDNFSVSQWDGQLRTLPGRRPRMDDLPMGAGENWQIAAGDAGYAGVLAESCDKGGRPVTVIYPAGSDVLALVREALSLLPPEKRWNVTFSTFYTKIYSSFECQWRFIFTGSPDAAAARKNPHSVVIDLAGPTPPKRATGGDLVEAARTGRFTVRTPAPPSGSGTSSGRSRPPNLPPIPPPNPLGEHDPRLRPPERVTTGDAEPIGSVPNPFYRPARRNNGMMMAVAFLGSLCVSLLAILGFMILRKPPEKVQAHVQTKNIQPPLVPAVTGSKRNKKTDLRPPDPGPEKVSATLPSNVPEPQPENPFKSEGTASPEPTKTTEPPAAPANQPLDDLRERKGRLRLPARGGGGGGLGGSSGTSAGPLLAKVYALSPTDCKLDLLGVEKAFGSASAGNILLERKDADGVSSWAVIRKPTGALSSKIETLGTFKLSGQDLSFHWNPTVPPAVKPDALRYCMLKVEVGTEAQVCRLVEPVAVDAIKLDKFDKASTFKLDLPLLDAAMLPDVESLMLQLKPIDLPGTVEQDSADPIPSGKSQSIRIRGGTDDRAILELTINFSFEKEKDKEDGREIRVKGWETYRADKLTLDEALKIGRPLSVKDLNARLKDRKDRVKNFEREARREDTDYQKQKGLLDPEIKRLASVAKVLKEEGAKEAERKRDGHIEQLRRVKESADMAQQKVTEAKEVEKQVQETLDLAQQLIAKKSTLEFRIFIMVDQEEVELYRSKGYSREF